MGAGLWSAMPGTRARYPQGREAESTLDLWGFLGDGRWLELVPLPPAPHKPFPAWFLSPGHYWLSSQGHVDP